MKITIVITKEEGTMIQESFTDVNLAKDFLDRFYPPVEEPEEEEEI